jgi:hypothetical protein
MQRLEWLIRNTREATSEQLELQAHWGRYLCVLVAGFLENALIEVYSEFAYRVGPESLAKFSAHHLGEIQNPKSERFVRTARAFREEWAGELEAFLAEDGRREAIDGVMAQRHLIAHGRDAGITVATVNTYLRKIVSVVELIEDQCSR